MATYNLAGIKLKHTTFEEFVRDFNIYNGELLNSKNLSKGINQLKYELEIIHALLSVITSRETTRWQPDIYYKIGEIVTYSANPDELTPDEAKESFYIAIREDSNVGKTPSIYDDYWKKIRLRDLYPELDFSNFILFENNQDWEATKNSDGILYGQVKQMIEDLFVRAQDWIKANYIGMNADDNKEFTPTDPKHVTNMGYVDAKDAELYALFDGLQDALKMYVYTDNNRKMFAIQDSVKAVYTTDEGFLPGGSSTDIGNTLKRFRTMYATNFVGTASQAKYADIAENYETDKVYPAGTLLGIDEDGITEYNSENQYFGVVSDKPGYLLNGEVDGIVCPVALKGIVPCKVKGPVKKGRKLYAKDGYASIERTEDFIGIALESTDKDGIIQIKV